jgi:hypothetical protein
VLHSLIEVQVQRPAELQVCPAPQSELLVHSQALRSFTKAGPEPSGGVGGAGGALFPSSCEAYWLAASSPLHPTTPVAVLPAPWT